ncbi:zinc ribbon domain-containing protein [Methylonatrum kenyense]|uniref:FmdB family zinc ribbon protein n=1 Tax=Methylonatrum kenyense TaxID=455253 RepID=UPI0020BF7139|nr:zinc ribbon domain-containing protein [Methylonatrum kenyense]MCK8516158.1 zinc ribbon domain-containing protein [Methylonatrum kenyense]
MPIYEYQCESCQHELEAIQRMSDAPLTDCPECSRASLRRKISAAGFRLAGGGWYETDFKSANKRNLAGDQKAGESKSKQADSGAGSSSGKSDAGKAASSSAAV